MGADDDRPGWVEREKKSFSELDRQRRERRSSGEARPASPGAKARADRAAKEYVKHLDTLFSAGKSGGEGERLAHAMREARGTPGLADACRAYRDAVGPPTDAGLVSLFLDSGDTELVLTALEASRAAHEAGELQPTAGLRTQLRMLAEGPDDDVAEAAEELLERL